MNDNKCYRCNKNQCSQGYRAKTTNPVKSKAQKALNLDTSSALKRDIKCCVKCISPPSRSPLHKGEVFARPENMLLNYIIDKLDKRTTTEKKFNEPEITETDPDKIDKYDLLLKKSWTNTKNSIAKYILVEIDEQQHFEKQQFMTDRTREKRFWNKYGSDNGVLRIRVGDGKQESMYSCISRNNFGCKVSNKELFDYNMDLIVNHIFNSLTGGNVVKHAYIELFNSIGIQDFKQTFEYIPKDQKQESSYQYKKYPNKIESLYEHVKKMKISENNRNKITKKIKTDNEILDKIRQMERDENEKELSKKMKNMHFNSKKRLSPNERLRLSEWEAYDKNMKKYEKRQYKYNIKDFNVGAGITSPTTTVSSTDSPRSSMSSISSMSYKSAMSSRSSKSSDSINNSPRLRDSVSSPMSANSNNSDIKKSRTFK